MSGQSASSSSGVNTNSSKPGDVLVSSANSWNLVGKCCWIPELPGRASFGGFVSVLRPNCIRVEPRFLFRLLRRPRSRIQKGWPETTLLGDVPDIVSGITKGRKLKVREAPYLAVANVQDRALNLAAIKSIEATEKKEIARYRLLPNDLVLTEGSGPDKLGRGTNWNSELSECIHQNHIFRVRLTSDRMAPLFANWLISGSRGDTSSNRQSRRRASPRST